MSTIEPTIDQTQQPQQKGQDLSNAVDYAVKAAYQRGSMAVLNVRDAQGNNPDKEAKFNEIAKNNQLTPEQVKQNEKYWAAVEEINKQKLDELFQKYPSLNEFYQNKDNANVAHDDIPNLAGLEENLHNFMTYREDAQPVLIDAARAATAGAIEGTAGVVTNTAEFLARTIPQSGWDAEAIAGEYMVNPNETDFVDMQTRQNAYDEMGQKLASDTGIQTARDFVDELVNGKAPEKGQKKTSWGIYGNIDERYGFVGRNILGGIRSMGAMIPSYALSAYTGVGAIGLAYAGMMEGTRAFVDDMRKNKGFGHSFVHGFWNGTVEAATEKLPMDRVIKAALNRDGFLKTFAKNYLIEMPTELAATALQGLADKISDDGLSKGFERWLKELPEDLAATAISVIPMSMGMAGVSRAVQRSYERDAQEVVAALSNLNNSAAESKLRGRSERVYRNLVRSIAGDKIENAYITKAAWDEYFQKQGIDPAVAAKDFGVENYGDMTDALSIPFDVYQSKLSASPHAPHLLADTKLSIDGKTINESQDYADRLVNTLREMTQKRTSLGSQLEKARQAEDTARQQFDNGELSEDEFLQTQRTRVQIEEEINKLNNTPLDPEDQAFTNIINEQQGIIDSTQATLEELLNNENATNEVEAAENVIKEATAKRDQAKKDQERYRSYVPVDEINAEFQQAKEIEDILDGLRRESQQAKEFQDAIDTIESQIYAGLEASGIPYLVKNNARANAKVAARAFAVMCFRELQQRAIDKGENVDARRVADIVLKRWEAVGLKVGGKGLHRVGLQRKVDIKPFTDSMINKIRKGEKPRLPSYSLIDYLRDTMSATPEGKRYYDKLLRILRKGEQSADAIMDANIPFANLIDESELQRRFNFHESPDSNEFYEAIVEDYGNKNDKNVQDISLMYTKQADELRALDDMAKAIETAGIDLNQVTDNAEVRRLLDEFYNIGNDELYQYLGLKGAEKLGKTKADFESMFDALDDLVLAESLEKLGESPYKIKSMTGWERGVDGKWTYEISDRDATIDESVVDDLKKNKNETTLDKLYKHDELYKAYPELRNVKVRIGKLGKNVRGEVKFGPSWKNGVGKIDEIVITTNSVMPLEKKNETETEARKRNLIHEIQHIIQQIEGWEEGGNDKLFNAIPLEKKHKDIANEIIAALGVNKKALKRSYIGGLLKYVKDNPKKTQAADDVAVKHGYKDAKTFLYMLEREAFNKSAYGQYFNLIGEAQARNASNRMNLTQKWVRNFLSRRTMDVAPEFQHKLKERARNFFIAQDVENALNDKPTEILTEEEAQKFREDKLETEISLWEKNVDKTLDDLINGKKVNKGILMLKQTPAIMKYLGAPFEELYLSRHAFEESLSKHKNITEEILKQLPRAMVNPIAVFNTTNNDKYPNAKVFLLNIRDKNGAPVIVPIEFKGYTDGKAEVTFALTAYAKNQEGVKSKNNKNVRTKTNKQSAREDWYDKNDLVYINRDIAKSQSSDPSSNPYRDILVQAMQNKTVLNEEQFNSWRMQYNPLLYQGEQNEQGDYQNPQGSFNRKLMNINLFATANESTFMHECAHFMLEMYTSLANDADASSYIKKEMETIKAHVGWQEGQTEFNREQHETFARSFEAYLMKGEAPSKELRGVFAKFKDWLYRIYRNLKALDVKLSPEITGVFDRMLATDAEIANLKEDDSLELFATAEEAGLSLEAFEVYKDACREELQKAQSKMREKIGKEIAHKKTKQYKDDFEYFKEEASNEWESLKAAVALRELASHGVEGKLNLKDLQSAGYDVDVLRQIQKYSRNTFYDRKGGVRGRDVYGESVFEDIADKFGYSSFEDMLEDMAALPIKSEYITREAERRALEKHFSQQENIDNEINDAMNNGLKGDRLAMELAILKAKIEETKGVRNLGQKEGKQEGKQEEKDKQKQKQKLKDEKRQRFKDRLNNVNRTAQSLRIAARNFIHTSLVKDITPSKYLVTMRKLSRQARDELMKKSPDFEKVVELKQQEMINFYMYSEAVTVMNAFDKRVKKCKEIARWSRDDKDKVTRVPELVLEAKRLVAMMKLGGNLERIMEALGYATKYSDENEKYTPITRDPKNYGDLRGIPVDAAFDVLDEAISLFNQARDQQTLINRGELVELLDARDELANDIRKNGPSWRYNNKDTAGVRGFLQFVSNYARDLTRMEAWCAMVGPAATKYIFEPIKNSAVQLRIKTAEMDMKLGAVFKDFKFQRGKIKADELGGYVFGTDTGYAKAEIMHVIMHMGNRSNLERLLLGEDIENGRTAWGTKDEETGQLDASRLYSFVNRMIREGVITEEDMDRVQKVWDLFEELKPESQKAHREVFGRHFREIPSDGFYMFGKYYRGGYVPAIYDKRYSKSPNNPESLDDLINQTGLAMPTPNAGWGKERTTGANRVLALDLMMLRDHMAKQIAFNTMAKSIQDVKKVLGGNVETALRGYDAKFMEQVIQPWMSRAYTQSMTGMDKNNDAFMNICRNLRNRAGAAIMMFNIPNVVEQVTDITAARAFVKDRYLADALRSMLSDRKVTVETVMNASDYMRTRIATEINAANSYVQRSINSTKLEDADAWVLDHAYFMQSAVDEYLGPLVWQAAYLQSIDQGMDHDNAVQFSDRVVRQSLGSNAAEDVANYEAGNAFKRMFTHFAGYFVQRANLVSERYSNIKNSDMSDARKRAAYCSMLLSTVMIPAWASMAIFKLMGGPDDKEDWGQFLLSVFGGGLLRYILPMAGWIGQGIEAISDMASGNSSAAGRLYSPPALNVIKDIGTHAYQWKKGFEDGSFFNRGGFKFLADMTHLGYIPVVPTRLLNSTIYAYDVANNNVRPDGNVDLIRGLATGKASPNSKK